MGEGRGSHKNHPSRNVAMITRDEDGFVQRFAETKLSIFKTPNEYIALKNPWWVHCGSCDRFIRWNGGGWFSQDTAFAVAENHAVQEHKVHL